MENTITKNTIKEAIQSVLDKSMVKGTRRCTSFEFCYNCFRSQGHQKDQERACAILCFYLVNWGDRSPFILEETNLKVYLPNY